MNLWVIFGRGQLLSHLKKIFKKLTWPNIFNNVDKCIEEIGQERLCTLWQIMHRTTMAPKELMIEKRPKMLCATHALNPMLAGIGNQIFTIFNDFNSIVIVEYSLFIDLIFSIYLFFEIEKLQRSNWVGEIIDHIHLCALQDFSYDEEVHLEKRHSNAEICKFILNLTKLIRCVILYGYSCARLTSSVDLST